jgi:cobyrinic acid a,c-diamide synthase
VLGARLVVAGTRSGAGKTTVATGLMAALTARGLRVGSAKVGPDYLDPGYHGLATGRPARNLDPWMSGLPLIGPLAARAGAGTDVLVVEGVMGLFDGAADATPSSTAEVAVELDAPVVLVVDASSMSQSVAALVHGYRTWDPRVRLAGVVLNLVGSDSHEAMLRSALGRSGVAVYGALRRDDALVWRSRHLGLRPVAEDPAAVRRSLDRLAAAIEASCDLDGLLALARSAPPRRVPPLPHPRSVTGSDRPRVAVASGAAFCFSYPDNLESLAAAGADVVPFDPCTDEQLPEATAAVVVGGGFPELHADALAANAPMLRAILRHHRSGGLTWAECGGLLWLSNHLDGAAMAGVVDAEATMDGGRVLGYRTATTTVDSPIGPAGTGLRGHEFHYSTTSPEGDALRLSGRQGTTTGGFASSNLLATYLHVHLAATPSLAEAFVAAAAGLCRGTSRAGATS